MRFFSDTARHLFVSASICLLAGCFDAEVPLDSEDQAQPLAKEAAAKEAKGAYDEAIALYVRLLDVEPTNARGHLSLGLVLEEHHQDYVAAIYHYRRYLSLRPMSEKKDLITLRVLKAKQQFSGTISDRSNAPGKVINDLKNKNQALTHRVMELEQLAAAAQARAESVLAAAPRPGARPDRGEVPTRALAADRPAEPDKPTPLVVRLPTTYHVQSGDTLEKIAIHFYGDRSRWKSIYEANRKVIRNKDRLQRGQELTIPKLG